MATFNDCRAREVRDSFWCHWALKRVVFCGLLLLVQRSPCLAEVARVSDKDFGPLIARLSENPGFFDSDNLVSNEASYLQVFGKLQKLGVKGGAYLGVGPEQNFTYIAKTRPRLAILVDIRRQNMLYHLLFKALFEISSDRLEYLANLFCRPLPSKPSRSKRRDVAGLLLELEKMAPSEALFHRNVDRVQSLVRDKQHLQISIQDTKIIEGIYREFFDQQLDIRFRSLGRPTHFRFYPTFKEIVLERDLEGRFGNYLNSEEDFEFVKKLHARNLIVPVVGDFSGPRALRAVGHYLREIKETVSVFYVSNVEFYLMHNGLFDRYGENIKELPLSDRSLFIRAYFRFPHPERRPGYISATVLQRMRAFIKNLDAGRYHSYQNLGVLDFVGNE